MRRRTWLTVPYIIPVEVDGHTLLHPTESCLQVAINRQSLISSSMQSHHPYPSQFSNKLQTAVSMAQKKQLFKKMMLSQKMMMLFGTIKMSSQSFTIKNTKYLSIYRCAKLKCHKRNPSLLFSDKLHFTHNLCVNYFCLAIFLPIFAQQLDHFKTHMHSNSTKYTNIQQCQ